MSPAFSGESLPAVKKCGVKRPVLYILVPFCLGLASCHSLSGIFNVPAIIWFLLGVLLIAVSLLFSARKALSHISLYIAIFFLGAVYYCNSNTLPPDHIANLVSDASQPRKAVLKGVIADDPFVEQAFFGGRKITFLLKVNAVNGAGRWQRAEGLAETRVYTRTDRVFRFGDEAILEGLISKPAGLRNPGLFDYAKYLANRNIYAVFKAKDGDLIEVVTGNPANPVRRLAYNIRAAMRSIIERHLDEPDSSFVKAILIGDRSGLGDELNDEFIKTGTVHILSISGLHVGLIALLVLAVFGLLGIRRKASLALTVVFLGVYSYIAGSSPPIIRSVVMFAVFAVGYIMERETDLLNSLAVAAFLILLWNPKELFGASFQLSFASIAGIFIFAPRINGILRTDSIGKGSFLRKAATYAAQGVSVSIAAWILTWPIIASYFNIASPVSVIANLAVIPVSFISMIVSFALLCASPFSGAVANIFALGVAFVDRTLFAINHFLSQLPLAYFRIPAPSAGYTAFYYALVLLWAAPAGHIAVGTRRISKAIPLMAILLALNIFTWMDCAKTARGVLKLTFLDVGNGDSALVEFPGGGSLLIDAGSGGEEGRFDAGRNVVAPYIWNEGASRIDAILITHPHADHLGGVIYLLENFKVGIVMDNGSSDGSDLYRAYLRAIRQGGSRHITVGEGDRLRLPAGAEFFILNPARGKVFADGNAGSVVGKLDYKNTSALFCADASGPALDDMADSFGDFLRSDIIKVPHHGGKAGAEKAINKFYRAVSPEVSIISAGERARRDWRQKNAITILNSRCYDTGRNGAITICVGEKGYTITLYKPRF